MKKEQSSSDICQAAAETTRGSHPLSDREGAPPAGLGPDRVVEAKRRRGKPEWDAHRRVLMWGGEVILRLSQRATNQIPVLNALEAAGWLAWIANPFQDKEGNPDTERLKEALKGLNAGQDRPLIRFRGDGKGTGLCWGPIEV